MSRRNIYCKNRKSVSLANVYSCFGSISNAFYLYTVTAWACSSTPYRAHAHPTKRCGYRVRLSAPCNNLNFVCRECFDIQLTQHDVDKSFKSILLRPHHSQVRTLCDLYYMGFTGDCWHIFRISIFLLKELFPFVHNKPWCPVSLYADVKRCKSAQIFVKLNIVKIQVRNG